MIHIENYLLLYWLSTYEKISLTYFTVIVLLHDLSTESTK